MLEQDNRINTKPKTADLRRFCYEAIIECGGSATAKEILDYVSSKYTDEIADEMSPSHPLMTKIELNLTAIRTSLKDEGFLELAPGRIWIIPTHLFKRTDHGLSGLLEHEESGAESIEDATEAECQSADTELIRNLKDAIGRLNDNGVGFERLVKRVLHAYGFDECKETNRSHDRGIDLTAILPFDTFIKRNTSTSKEDGGSADNRVNDDEEEAPITSLPINEILFFRYAFQCKKYRGRIGSPMIRDFRGSITDKVDRAVFITTSSFTMDAIEEAKADGKRMIELWDGDLIVKMMIEKHIGIMEINGMRSVDVEYLKALDT